MKKYMCTLLLWFACCYLGLHDGYLTLWETNDTTKKIVFPYHISMYPPLDAELLSKGIPIASQTHMSQCLEDYMS